MTCALARLNTCLCLPCVSCWLTGTRASNLHISRMRRCTRRRVGVRSVTSLKSLSPPTAPNVDHHCPRMDFIWTARHGSFHAVQSNAAVPAQIKSDSPDLSDAPTGPQKGGACEPPAEPHIQTGQSQPSRGHHQSPARRRPIRPNRAPHRRALLRQRATFWRQNVLISGGPITRGQRALLCVGRGRWL